VRALFDATNADDPARTDAVLARSFLSYDVHGTRSRTGLKRHLLEDNPPVDRTTTNAWEDVDFLAAVRATARRSGSPVTRFA
jgi:hypothetical protein